MHGVVAFSVNGRKKLVDNLSILFENFFRRVFDESLMKSELNHKKNYVQSFAYSYEILKIISFMCYSDLLIFSQNTYNDDIYLRESDVCNIIIFKVISVIGILENSQS